VVSLVLRRLGAMVMVLLVLTAAMFVLRQVTPNDPVKELLGPHASASARATLTHKLWLDRPLALQYVHYVDGLLHGNFQESIHTRRPVGSDIASDLPPTLEIAIVALVVAILLGALLALASVGRWRGAGVLRIVMVGGSSAPVFLLGLLAVLLLYGKLGWFPATGQTRFDDAPTGPTRFLLIDSLVAGRIDVFGDALWHLTLPVLSVAIGPAVAIGRVLRSSLLANMGSDYVRTARAKGLSETTVLFRHALRNSIGAALAMTGLQAGLMFAGVVVVEVVFAWPGLGSYAAQSISVGDFPSVAGVTLVIGAAYVVINTLVDIFQALADPRIRA
jgi:peptide/nickel transport system permease protein